MKLLKLVTCLVGIATLLAAASIAHAQNSQLPPCPGSYSPTWSNCVGTETWSSGNNYVGEFRDGKLHGQGTYNYAKGDKYVGEFKDNTFHGQGTYYFLAENQFKGDKYVGEYRDDKKTGWGVYTFADGRQYVGEWADGKNNGLGIFYDSQKQPVRSGKFQDNKLVESLRLDPVRFAYVSQPTVASLTSSQPSQLPPCQGNNIAMWSSCVGTEIWPDGEKYVGEYLNGKKIGQGTLTWASGNKYVGEFRNNRQHGQGTYTYANGSKYVGEFRDGYLDGQGTFTWADGAKYVGEYKENKKSGRAMVTYADGSWYAGNYQNDKRHGWGVYTFASKVQYVGEFKNGDFNGMGIEYNPDRTIRNSGRFENDKLVESTRLDPVRFAYVSQPNLATAKPAPTPTSVTLAANTEEQRRQAAEIERLRLENERAREDKRRAEEALAQVQQQQSQQSVSKPAALSRNVDAHALVIGNAAYPSGNRLDNPVNDARAISQKLRALGFKVTEVVDANRARLVSALGQFNKSAANAELSLLFYSGHGVQVFGTNYILPIDVDQTDPAQATLQGVSLNSAVEQFMPGKTKLVFLDACRDNPFVRSGSRGVSKGLAPISVAQGTLIAYATKDGQVASDGVGQKNSPFTTALLQHLDDPQDIAIVLRKVRERVVSTTNGKQEPWEYGSLTGGELILSRIKAGMR